MVEEEVISMRKGFTLVELLAVIVILSLLTLLTINIVTNIVASGKDEISDNQKVLIEKALFPFTEKILVEKYEKKV